MDLLNYEEITLCAKTQTEPYLSFGLLSYIYFFYQRKTRKLRFFQRGCGSDNSSRIPLKHNQS